MLVAGLALLLAAVVVTLLHAERRQAGSNQVAAVEEVVNRRGSWRRCQEGENVPKDAAVLRLLVGTNGRPAPGIRVTASSLDGDVVTTGRLAPGGRQGPVEIPMRLVEATQVGLRVCVSVAGSGQTVLYGERETLRLEWWRDGRESWFALLPAIAHRFGLAKANPLGGLLLVGAGLVLLLCWVAAIRLLLREVGR